MTTIHRTHDATMIIPSSSTEGGEKAHGTMNTLALQQWLAAQVGDMWDKVSNATNQVDARNDAQREITALQNKATAGEPITAEDIYKVTDAMPEGPEKEALLAMAPKSGTPEELQAAEDNVKKADEELRVARESQLKHNKTMQDAGTPHVEDNVWDKAVHDAEGRQKEAVNQRDSLLKTTTITGPGVADSFKNAAGSLDKQNQLAMTELQYIASAAQQAMSLTSNILKVQSEMAEGAIRNLV